MVATVAADEGLLIPQPSIQRPVPIFERAAFAAVVIAELGEGCVQVYTKLNS